MTVETWLLDSDPSIRWQAQRDTLGLPEPEWANERARIETHG
ncbi:MAG: squalene cyclase, partial [Acidimicrobiia bacterium]